MSFRTVSRAVMGLPNDSGKEPALAPAANAPTLPTEPAAVDAAPVSANPWESASAELRGRTAAPPVPSRTEQTRAGTAEPAVTSWAPPEERSGSAFAGRMGRGLLWFILLLAAVTGVRSWFFPPQAPPSAPSTEQSGTAYPRAEAQALAARFARAYLSWDEDAPGERERQLAALLPPGSDTDMGWDGKGGQTVRDVQPAKVSLAHGDEASVRVEVLVEPDGERRGNRSAADTAARWLGLDVPVVATSAGVVVSGPPGIVGLPERGARAPERTGPRTDDALSARTRSAVDTFFAAHASGDTGSATAPGARVPALPKGIGFDELLSWRADADGKGGKKAGGNDEHTGTAVVRWSVGGARLEQTYRVRVVRVSAANVHRWQVAELHGGSAALGRPGS